MNRLRPNDLGWLVRPMRRKTKASRVLEELVRALKDLLLHLGFLLLLAQRAREDPAQWTVDSQVCDQQNSVLKQSNTSELKFTSIVQTEPETFKLLAL